MFWTGPLPSSVFVTDKNEEEKKWILRSKERRVRNEEEKRESDASQHRSGN